MDNNDIGNRGETIFASRISANYDFKAYFMGEKAPIGDFILEINDENTPYECMVQVKGTTQGYNVGDGKLKAKVEAAKLQKLLNRPLPTYVAGLMLIKKRFILRQYSPQPTIIQQQYL